MFRAFFSSTRMIIFFLFLFFSYSFVLFLFIVVPVFFFNFFLNFYFLLFLLFFSFTRVIKYILSFLPSFFFIYSGSWFGTYHISRPIMRRNFQLVRFLQIERFEQLCQGELSFSFGKVNTDTRQHVSRLFFVHSYDNFFSFSFLLLFFRPFFIHSGSCFFF